MENRDGEERERMEGGVRGKLPMAGEMYEQQSLSDNVVLG